jgi:hypothetical protein
MQHLPVHLWLRPLRVLLATRLRKALQPREPPPPVSLLLVVLPVRAGWHPQPAPAGHCCPPLLLPGHLGAAALLAGQQVPGPAQPPGRLAAWQGAAAASCPAALPPCSAGIQQLGVSRPKVCSTW